MWARRGEGEAERCAVPCVKQPLCVPCWFTHRMCVLEVALHRLLFPKVIQRRHISYRRWEFNIRIDLGEARRENVDWTQLAQGPMSGFREYCYEPLGFIKAEDLFIR